jgi:indole-3-glycerol phosphate synthase
MYKNEQEESINFKFILDCCKKRFMPFDKKITIDREPKDLIAAIKEYQKNGKNPIISEIKFRSPAGDIRRIDSPEKIALEMIKGGSCAISVLTEPIFFGGSLEFLKKVREVSPIPLLRKDFIFDPAQIPESYYYGADSLLLIASFFDRKSLTKLIQDSRKLGMEPLVEVHSPGDIERAADSGARLFAINNRDPDTLKINLERTALLAPLIKGVKVSASGIEKPPQLKEALKYSDAALIGSSIMRAGDIESMVKGFTGA